VTDAETRGDLAQRLLPVAARLACIVHGDGGQPDIHHLLTQLDPAEKDALIVVLAALVDPDRSLGDALAFVTWDEHGTPAPPETAAGPIRAAAGYRWATPSGVREALLREDVLRARHLHVAEERPLTEVARLVGVDPQTVLRWKKSGWRRAA